MSDNTNKNIIEKTIINRFDRTKENNNSVIDNETLQEYSVDSILTDEENRTLWINGMPFGNAYIHFAGESVSGTQPTHAEIFNDFDNNVATGNYSHAEGYNNKTEATYSHVEGQKNIINSDPKDNAQAAHAEGRENTINNAPNSHVEGKGNKIETDGREAHVEGYGNTATAQAAHAEGMGTIAMGKGSHTEGMDVAAVGKASHAEGNSAKSIKDVLDTDKFEQLSKIDDLTPDQLTDLKADIEKAWTNEKNADGNTERKTFSMAFGIFSHTEGLDNLVIGPCSHSEGQRNLVIGGDAHAEGKFNTVIGGRAHAEGFETTAEGHASHAEGHGTHAVKPQSHAEGKNTKANGNNSHAEGLGTIANNEAEHASGKYNVSNTGTIFSVGIGTSDKTEDRKNAVDIIKKQSGNDYITTVHTDLNIANDKIVTIGDPQEYSGDNNINIDNTKLRVAGGIYVDGDLVTTGTHYIVDVETDLAKELHVEGITQIDGDTTIGTANKSANLEVYGDTTLKSELTVTGATNLGDTLIVNDDATLKGNTEIGTDRENILKVWSNTELFENLTVGGDTELESTEISTLTVEGETTLSTTYVGNKLIDPQDKGVLQVGGNVTIETTNGEYSNISLNVNNTTKLEQLTVQPPTYNYTAALQVDTNGNVYLGPDQDGNNPCNYAGIAGETPVTVQSLIVNQDLEEVTYNELYRRRYSGELKPGKFYRIVDYITTTTQENTVSAGYQFDIIVLALSKNTLSEDAWTVQHDFSKNENNVDITLLQRGFTINADTIHFNNCNITLPNNLFTFYLRGNENSDNQLDIKLVEINGDTIINPKNLQNIDISFNDSTILENVKLFEYNKFSTEYLLFVDYTKYSVITCDDIPINIYGMYIVDNTPLCSFTLNNSKYLFLAYTGVENGDGSELYVVFIPIHVVNCTPTNDAITFTGAIVLNTGLNSNTADKACLSFLRTCFNTDYKEISILVNATVNTKLAKDIILPESAVKDTKIQITLNDYGIPRNNQSSLWCEVYDEDLGKNDIKISSYSNLQGKLEYHFENSKLNEWKLRYCLNNAKDRFDWADEQNGKGVIYRMIDEFGNDCPYDFKNIMLNTKPDSEESEYNYIFSGDSFVEVEDNPYPKNNEDWSIIGEIKNNHIFCNTSEIPTISFFSYISNSTMFGGELKKVCKNNTIINSNNILVNRCQNNYIINKNYTNITEITGNTQFIFGGNILADNVYQSNQ